MAGNGEPLVLITGGTGFIGVHCIIKCLAANYRVRTTIRSLKREKDVREMLALARVTSNLDRLSFIEADLTKDAGWTEAAKGCTYVLHVASPFPAAAPKHEDDLIIPAREGTLRVLRASKAAGVKRVVVTSSMAAMHAGLPYEPSKVFIENDWADINGPHCDAYAKSKTLAERAAWDFIEQEGGSMELAVINPVSVLGPVLSSDMSSSVEIPLQLLNGSLPGCPRLNFSVVDVRDVADLHLLAMTSPKAKGERFICDSPPSMSMKEMSVVLRERLGKAARKCPTMVLPDILLKTMALFNPTVALVVHNLGKVELHSIDKAKTLLGWEPRSNVEALMASAESLIELKIVKS